MLLATQKEMDDHQLENSIHHRVTILASPEKIFTALTNSELIDEWGGGPSRVEARSNGIYSLWDGEAVGNIREIQRPYHLLHTMRLYQSWHKDWQDSLVTWKIVANKEKTILSLRNSCLPNLGLKETLNEHWTENFLGPLKAYLDNLSLLKRR